MTSDTQTTSIPDASTGPEPGAYNLLVGSKCVIAAPASHVFEILVDLSTWQDWNSFCPNVDILSRPSGSTSNRLVEGTRMLLHPKLSGLSIMDDTPVLVTELSYPKDQANPNSSSASFKVSWGLNCFSSSSGMLRTHRENEVNPSDVNGNNHEECIFSTWEGMSGPLAHAVKLMFGNRLQTKFEESANNLKAYAERTWEEKCKQNVMA